MTGNRFQSTPRFAGEGNTAVSGRARGSSRFNPPVRVVTIIDINLIKISETRLDASSEDPRRSFSPDVSNSLQPGQRTVPFPIGRGTERSFSDEPL